MVILVTCKIDGCERGGILRKGMCEGHYRRWRRHADPLGGVYRRDRGMSREAFLAWVKSNLVPNGECLDWRGPKDRDGYGRAWLGGVRFGVHRLMLEAAKGAPLDENLFALHTCDRPSCANPDHLYWGTQADNTRDMDARGRRGVRMVGTRIGEQIHNSKLNPIAVRVVRFLAARGVSVARLARAHGLSEGCLRHVIKGRAWTHVPVSA